MDVKPKPSQYNEKKRDAIYKHRRANIDAYNAYQRAYYKRKAQDPEWRHNRAMKCREANKKYRNKKLMITEPKPRGRPKHDESILENYGVLTFD